MNRSHTDGVEADEAENRPVKCLCLHDLADKESHSSLLLTVVGTVFATFYTGTGKT